MCGSNNGANTTKGKETKDEQERAKTGQNWKGVPGEAGQETKKGGGGGEKGCSDRQARRQARRQAQAAPTQVVNTR